MLNDYVNERIKSILNLIDSTNQRSNPGLLKVTARNTSENVSAEVIKSTC